MLMASHILRFFTLHQIALALFRWMLILLFYSFWPWFVRRRSNASEWTEKKEVYWLQQRAKIVVWLIIFELLVCENLIWRFVS